MKEKVFLDKSNMPDENKLKSALANSYDFYVKLMDLAKDFETKWTFYKGWSLKVFRKNKALFYIVPYLGAFDVSMAIRESERDKMMSDPALAPFYTSLQNAEKYLEGYGIKIEIFDKNSFILCFDFVSKLISYR